MTEDDVMDDLAEIEEALYQVRNARGLVKSRLAYEALDEAAEALHHAKADLKTCALEDLVRV